MNARRYFDGNFKVCNEKMNITLSEYIKFCDPKFVNNIKEYNR
jgi:hypothetical protein